MGIISAERALKLVEHLDDGQLRQTVRNVFVDREYFPTGLRGDDQPEDLFIPLLSTERAAAVVAGCSDVLEELAPNLFAQVPSLKSEQTDTLYHLMTLIGAGHPPELQWQTQGLLNVVLRPDASESIRGPVVRAALAYARTENEARIWEPLIANDLVPGYAFKALLQIDPYALRIKRYLVALWRRKLKGELQTEVLSLTRDAVKARDGDESFAYGIIKELTLVMPEEQFPAIEHELQRFSWSQSWLTFFRKTKLRLLLEAKMKRTYGALFDPDAMERSMGLGNSLQILDPLVDKTNLAGRSWDILYVSSADCTTAEISVLLGSIACQSTYEKPVGKKSRDWKERYGYARGSKLGNITLYDNTLLRSTDKAARISPK